MIERWRETYRKVKNSPIMTETTTGRIIANQDLLSGKDLIKGLNALVIGSIALAGCSPDTNSPRPVDILPSDQNSTQLAPSPEATAGITAQILDQQQVLGIKVDNSHTLNIVFDQFKQNSEVTKLFEDPTSVQYSAFGIDVFNKNTNQDTKYSFFSAVSDKDQRGFTFMVFEPKPGEVQYIGLNRVLDSSGHVGLGITQDMQTGQEIQTPVVIFSTDLTVDQAATMSVDEIKKHDLLFIPGGVKVPQDKLFGSTSEIAYRSNVQIPTPTEVAPVTVSPTETIVVDITPTETAPVQQDKIFTLTDKTTYSMPQFETPEEVMKYIEGDAYWRTEKDKNSVIVTWQDKEPSSFTSPLKKLPGLQMVFDQAQPIFPLTGDKYFTLQSYEVDGGTIVTYQNVQKEFKVVFIPIATRLFDLQVTKVPVVTPTP